MSFVAGIRDGAILQILEARSSNCGNCREFGISRAGRNRNRRFRVALMRRLRKQSLSVAARLYGAHIIYVDNAMCVTHTLHVLRLPSERSSRRFVSYKRTNEHFSPNIYQYSDTLKPNHSILIPIYIFREQR